jgi:hypothetical protein
MRIAAAFALAVSFMVPATARADEVADAAQEAPASEWAEVRLTYYRESGVTYSGEYTYAGSTACSWNFALGTRFVLPDGEEFVCNDRGMLGSTGWLDLFRRPDLAAKYGPYVTVEVVR